MSQSTQPIPNTPALAADTQTIHIRPSSPLPHSPSPLVNWKAIGIIFAVVVSLVGGVGNYYVNREHVFQNSSKVNEVVDDLKGLSDELDDEKRRIDRQEMNEVNSAAGISKLDKKMEDISDSVQDIEKKIEKIGTTVEMMAEDRK